jgi:integrase
MVDRRIDLRSADIGSLNPPSSRRMVDFRDKREPGLALRAVSKANGDAKRAWTWRYRDGSGKQRRIIFGHWPEMTYAEAVDALKEARKERNAGVDPIAARNDAARALAGRATVSDLIDRYAVIRAPSLKSGGEIVRLLRKHVEPVLGAMAGADVTEDHIHVVLTTERERLAKADAEIAKLDAERRRAAQKAGKPAPRPLKRRTFIQLNRVAAAMGSMFTFAVGEKVIKSSPMPKLTKGKGVLPSENEKGRDFSDAEVRRVWTGIAATRTDVRTKNALRLVLLTAMRPGEVLKLRRRDVDLSAGFVDRRGGGERRRDVGLVILLDPKNRLSRVIPLSTQARAVLADALKNAGPKPDDFVFPAETTDEDAPAKPMGPRALARAMSRRFDVFGVDITPHRLRAMAANLVERLGFGSLAASDVLGHIDRSVNRRSYSSYDNLPARADALDAVATEIERIAAQASETAPAPSTNVVSLKRA